LATFFGLGYLPKAPGTFGALGAFLISFVLVQFHFDFNSFQIINLFLIVISYFVGVVACNNLREEWGSDPSKVVIDEACGYWVTIMFVPISFANLFVGFVLFRFFDILKPLGIRKIDRMHNSSHAVMLDDVAAGLYGCIILNLINYLFEY
jgi:phosphatidylglycerophosphatase A